MNLVFLVTNIAGAIIYVKLSSYSWAIPQERGLNSTTGEPFTWALSVMPIWALFFLVNLIWGAIVARRRQWRDGRLWSLAGCIWLIGLVIDFTHH